MKKSNRKELSFEQTEKLVTLALEERNPFEIIKKEFGLAEKEVLEIMKKKMPLEKYNETDTDKPLIAAELKGSKVAKETPIEGIAGARCLRCCPWRNPRRISSNRWLLVQL
mgnify:CR=1 FL=1